MVTCPKKLVLHIDALMLNPMAGTREEKLLSDWWSRCAPAAGLIGRTLECGLHVTLSRPGRTCRLPFGRSMHCNLNLSGALWLPTGAISSGSTYHIPGNAAAFQACGSAVEPTVGRVRARSDGGGAERCG